VLSDRRQAKSAIDIVFKSLRHAIQSEANAAPPDDPTLFESEYRSKYLKEVLERTGINILRVRESNKVQEGGAMGLPLVQSRESDFIVS
jgi:hypothetical protein